MGARVIGPVTLVEIELDNGDRHVVALSPATAHRSTPGLHLTPAMLTEALAESDRLGDLPALGSD